MGNRAVIAFGSDEEKDVGIYLHWNGGEESVKAFLKVAKDLGVRDPMNDNYGIARIAQIIGNFFGGSNSVGVANLKQLDCDNYDNGMFIIGNDFQIVDRKYNRQGEQEMCQGVYDEALKINDPIFNRN